MRVFKRDVWSKHASYPFDWLQVLLWTVDFFPSFLCFSHLSFIFINFSVLRSLIACFKFIWFIRRRIQGSVRVVTRMMRRKMMESDEPSKIHFNLTNNFQDINFCLQFYSLVCAFGHVRINKLLTETVNYVLHNLLYSK